MSIPKTKTLLDRTFDEGVALTTEVRNYIAYREANDKREMDLSNCLLVSYHYTRVSARMIQSMTWLLAMRALLIGEISPDQFTIPQYSIADSEECSSEKGSNDKDLPAGLRDLLTRSYAFYSRILRLDNIVRENLSLGQVPNFGN